MRKKRWPGSRPVAVRTQREVLRDVMLTAAKYDAWLTLKELARFTRYGEASISAQLRHLRKAKYGGFALAKRQRASLMRGCVDEPRVTWEYRIGHPGVLAAKPKSRRTRVRRRRLRRTTAQRWRAR